MTQRRRSTPATKPNSPSPHRQAGSLRATPTYTKWRDAIAADAQGLDVRIFSGFADETVSRLVAIDGVDEVPLAVVELGPFVVWTLWVG
jgi:hypothetical protein